MASDVRSLPDTTLNLYLYAIGAWGLALVVLFLTGRTPLAIPLVYAVALWQIGVTVWWGPTRLKRYEAGELTRQETDAGVSSVGKIMSASSLLPAIVFLAEEPLASQSWLTVISICAVAGVAYAASSVAVRVSNRWTHGLVLLGTGLTLPLNTTGAVSVASAIGFFDAVMH